MREQLDAIAKFDAVVLAVDPHESWSAKFLLKEVGFDKDDVHYPLLTDPTYTVSAAYGVAFQMRIHTEVSNRPGTFVIDRKGILRYAKRGRNFADRPTPEAIISELDKL